MIKGTTEYFRFSEKIDGKEVGRAYLYLIKNEHERPYGLIEDIFVATEHRGKGHGSRMLRKALAMAERHKCYKVIATSRNNRPRVHEMYKRFGFAEHGKEFRIEID